MKRQIKKVLKKRIPKSIVNSRSTKISKYLKCAKIAEYDPQAFETGINLIGPIQQSSGLGQSCRLLERAIKSTGISYKVFPYDSGKNGKINSFSKNLTYKINIFHINAHEFEYAFYQLRKESWDKHYNIAYWLWELEDFPDKWIPYTNIIDEIWTPAEFVSNSIRKKVNIPVKTVPYWLQIEIDSKLSRKSFGLPEDKFLYFIAYDKNSVSERKNPQGCIDAFKRAFLPDNKNIGLVIKINHAAELDVHQLKEQLTGYNVYFIEKILSKLEMDTLISLMDVYMSLHRAEGFGLILAEAMALGTPVIATNYSANTEFMNSDVACMVDYQKVVLKEDIWPYEKGNCWAEPDIGQAAKYLRRLYEEPRFYNEVKIRAKKYIHEQLSEYRVSQIIETRCNTIFRTEREK